MQDAIRADQSVQFEEGKYEYMDNAENIQQQMVDAQKAEEVANKFADFEEVENGKEGK
jgi:hypothetical protein